MAAQSSDGGYAPDIPQIDTSPPDENGNTTTTITNPDGSQDVVVTDANGNFVGSNRVNPDGSTEEPTGPTTAPANGGRPQHVPPDARVDANGDHVWTDQSGDVHRVDADTGDRLRRKPDGTIYRRREDGSRVRKNPDGSYVRVDVDGNVTRTAAPGGGVDDGGVDDGGGGSSFKPPADARVDANGDSVWTDKNGDVRRYDASSGDQLRRTADGTVYRRRPDGTVNRLDPDGTQTRRNPDGSRVRKNPDGSYVRVDVDGNVTRTAAPGGGGGGTTPPGTTPPGTTPPGTTPPGTTPPGTTPGPSNRPDTLNVLQPWNQPLEEVLPPRPDFGPLEGPTTELPEYEAGDPLVTPEYESGEPFVAPEYESPDPFVAPTMADVMQRPGYKFGLEQGQIALENSAASRGMLRHGNTMREMLKYGSDYATTKYGDSYNRMIGEWKTMQDEGRYSHEQDYTGALDEFKSQVDERRYAYDAAYRAAVDEHLSALGERRYDHEQGYTRAKSLRDEEAEREAVNAGLVRGDYQNEYDQSVDRWTLARNTYWQNQDNAFDRTRWKAELGLV